jgi:hypothetical protein
MIGFIDIFLYILFLNHNQLQELTINLQPKTSALIAEDSLHSRSHPLSLEELDLTELVGLLYREN